MHRNMYSKMLNLMEKQQAWVAHLMGIIGSPPSESDSTLQAAMHDLVGVHKKKTEVFCSRIVEVKRALQKLHDVIKSECINRMMCIEHRTTCRARYQMGDSRLLETDARGRSGFSSCWRLRAR